MQRSSPDVVDSFGNLRSRISRLLRRGGGTRRDGSQLSLGISGEPSGREIVGPANSVYEFLDFMADAVPNGEIYIFGGLIRDVALFGIRGFKSDVDVVVDGDWESAARYLQAKGAVRNKFGGFRLVIGGWPVDIWNARDTWAIKNGYVEYRGVASLIETTIFNWDAILMNWRTKSFVCGPSYIEDLAMGHMDIVLLENPNPLGMAVRVFRNIGLTQWSVM